MSGEDVLDPVEPAQLSPHAPPPQHPPDGAESHDGWDGAEVVTGRAGTESSLVTLDEPHSGQWAFEAPRTRSSKRLMQDGHWYSKSGMTGDSRARCRWSSEMPAHETDTGIKQGGERRWPIGQRMTGTEGVTGLGKEQGFRRWRRFGE